MSETFRNTTFVIAIRDAGYVCNELLRVYGGIDDSGKWTATCSEMLAYTLGVMANGDLRVEPMMQYFDEPGRTCRKSRGRAPAAASAAAAAAAAAALNVRSFARRAPYGATAYHTVSCTASTRPAPPTPTRKSA